MDDIPTNFESVGQELNPFGRIRKSLSHSAGGEDSAEGDRSFRSWAITDRRQTGMTDRLGSEIVIGSPPVSNGPSCLSAGDGGVLLKANEIKSLELIFDRHVT
jgi:hypothetical protein